MIRKLSLEEALKKEVLKEGQEYLADYLAKAPDPIGVYEHSRPTKTCAEKIALLKEESDRKWESYQAIRTVYFKHGGLLRMVVTPELGVSRIDTTPCFERTLGIATVLPEYMEQGTCTPFVPDWEMSCAAGMVQHFYIHYAPKFKGMLADFSIGGKGPEAQRRSLWIPYDDAISLLQKEFGELVTVQDVYTRQKRIRSKSYKRGDEVQAHAR
jgi:hypothetical protein